jgi:hypothetical protein
LSITNPNFSEIAFSVEHLRKVGSLEFILQAIDELFALDTWLIGYIADFLFLKCISVVSNSGFEKSGLGLDNAGRTKKFNHVSIYSYDPKSMI